MRSLGHQPHLCVIYSKAECGEQHVATLCKSYNVDIEQTKFSIQLDKVIDSIEHIKQSDCANDKIHKKFLLEDLYPFNEIPLKVIDEYIINV